MSDESDKAARAEKQASDVTVKASLFHVLVTGATVLIALITALLTAGRFYLDQSLQTADARLDARLKDTESRLSKEIQDAGSADAEAHFALRAAARFLRDRITELSPKDRRYLDSLLSQASAEGTKEFIDGLPPRPQLTINDLDEKPLREWQGKLSGLHWAGDKRAQVRFVEAIDPTLDLNGVDFQQVGRSDPCATRTYPLSSRTGLKFCYRHLNGPLEMVFTRNASAATQAHPDRKE